MVPVTDMKPVWVALIIATALMLSAHTAFAETPAQVPSAPTTAYNSTRSDVALCESRKKVAAPMAC